MSGHSKWATTKHQKAIKDQRRAKSFAKLIKNIEVAAKIGGADMSGNPTLVDAVQKAKKTSVPNSNIDNAIKRGSGQLGEAVDYQTIMYEGYGPGESHCSSSASPTTRTARQRMSARIVSRNGGNMGDPGSVAYNFNRKGVIIVDQNRRSNRGRHPCWPSWMPAPKKSTTAASASRSSPNRTTSSPLAPRCRMPASTTTPPTSSSFPTCSVEVDLETARKIFRLIDALEDNDDVQNVYGNFDIPADVQAALDDEE